MTLVRRALLGVLAAILAVPVGPEARAVAAPERIVSLNLCTDQLLLLIAERQQISGLTFLVRDSAMAGEAEGVPTHRGTAEEVLALSPDLILAGPYAGRATVDLLRQLGYEVIDIPPANSFASFREQMQALGTLIGREAAAKEAIEAFDTRLAAVQLPQDTPREVLAQYGANGWSTGGGTLLAEMAHHAGFDLLAERLGVVGGRAIGLEELVLADPSAMLLADEGDLPPSLATMKARHAVVRAMAENKTVVNVPPSWSVCGSMKLLNGVERLARARREVGE